MTVQLEMTEGRASELAIILQMKLVVRFEVSRLL